MHIYVELGKGNWSWLSYGISCQKVYNSINI